MIAPDVFARACGGLHPRVDPPGAQPHAPRCTILFTRRMPGVPTHVLVVDCGECLFFGLPFYRQIPIGLVPFGRNHPPDPFLRSSGTKTAAESNPSRLPPRPSRSCGPRDVRVFGPDGKLKVGSTCYGRGGDVLSSVLKRGAKLCYELMRRFFLVNIAGKSQSRSTQRLW